MPRGTKFGFPGRKLAEAGSASSCRFEGLASKLASVFCPRIFVRIPGLLSMGCKVFRAFSEASKSLDVTALSSPWSLAIGGYVVEAVPAPVVEA